MVGHLARGHLLQGGYLAAYSKALAKGFKTLKVSSVLGKSKARDRERVRNFAVRTLKKAGWKLP